MNKLYNEILDKKYHKLKELLKTYAGYPCNAKFDYSVLYPFLEMPLNNVGDPFCDSNYQLNTHDFEKEVIAFVAALYRSEENYWGYMTNGGTEGNLCGLNIARNLYNDAIVYYSKSSHYSIPKSVNITRSRSVIINCLDNGEMDYHHLLKELIKNTAYPAILMCNIGTTMTGAIDNIASVKEMLSKAGITNYYIHCDAALHGMIIPFLDNFNLSLNDIDSISISGHKFIGSPIPCGVYLTKKSIIDNQSNYIEYVGVNDATITGSRNALSVLFLWYVINYLGKEYLSKMAKESIYLADYTISQLKKFDIKAWRNDNSPIVVFPKPSKKLIRKWELASYQNIAHIVTLSHLTEEVINQFVKDLYLDTLEKEAQIYY